MRIFPINNHDAGNQPERLVIRESIWNGLTILALLGTLAAVIILLMVFNNAASSGDPGTAPVAGAVNSTPTATKTATLTVPVPTDTATLAPTMPAPSDTPSVSASPTTEVIIVEATPAQPPAPIPTPDPAEKSRYAFGLAAEPQGLNASLYQPARGCAWMGVAGRAFDIQNRPVKGIRVQLSGWLNGHTVNLLSLTGTALQYGPSGYEFTLAEAPMATTGWLKIQLLDQSDLPLSSIVVLDTYAECEKNLILVDFKQITE